MPDPFSFPDPFAQIDPFSSYGGGGRRRQAAFPPLSDADTDAGIQGLTGKALSGIGYVGSELDKLFGGRAVRAGVNTVTHALQGKGSLNDLRDISSIIPGSDVLGWTDEKETVTGEDLWRNVGYDPSKGNWLERNLVGPATEIALDPSTYLGGIGALTKAGKIASKTGALTKGFIPSIAAGERTLMHGFTGPGTAAFAQGAADLAGKVNVGLRKVPLVAPLEDAATALGGKARLVGRSLFDTKAGPVANAEVQRANEFVRQPAKDAAVQAARGQTFDLYGKLQPVLDAGADPEEVYRHLTQLGEGVAPTSAPSLVPHAATLDAIGKELRALYDPMPAAEAALGLKGGAWGSQYDLDYMLRRATKAGVKQGASTEKAFRVTNPSQIRRKEIFDVPGGTVQLEDMIRDPNLSGANRTLNPKQVRDEILKTHMDAASNATTGTFPLDFPKVARRNSGGLSRYLGGVKDDYVNIPGRAEPPIPFFNRDVPANFLARATRGADVTSAAKAVHDVIGNVGVAGGPGVNAAKVLHRAGLRGDGAYESALRALKQDPAAVIAQAQAAAGNKPFSPTAAMEDALKGFALPEAEAAAATKYMNRFTTPEEVGPVVKALDSALNLFKAGTYAVWPASHGRNMLSGVAENALEGTVNPAVYGEARGALKGLPLSGAVDPSFVGPMAHDPRTALLRDAYTHGVIGSPQGEVLERVGVRVPEVGAGNPALPRPGLAEIAGDAGRGLATGEGRNPFGVAGVGGRQADTNALVKAGRAVGSTVEDNLRLSQFLDLRRKGFDPRAAADKVFGTHFDYANGLTDFEQKFMKRLIPYYTFSRHNIPKQVGRAVTEPLKVSAPLRLSGGMRDEGGYVPEYLQSGMAIPVGDGQDGTQRYLSQFGLPFEEAFSRLKVGKGPWDTAWKTAEGLMGTLRPEVKFALENATGRQFFTGRDLNDLNPGKVASLGGILDDETARPLAQVIANTPATRAISTVNKLLDERKGFGAKALSLLTGARLTDVDTDKWRAIDARHNLEELMRGQTGIRQSTDFYPTPQAKAEGSLTPEQQYELRLYAGMKLRAREAAAQKRVGVQMRP